MPHKKNRYANANNTYTATPKAAQALPAKPAANLSEQAEVNAFSKFFIEKTIENIAAREVLKEAEENARVTLRQQQQLSWQDVLSEAERDRYIIENTVKKEARSVGAQGNAVTTIKKRTPVKTNLFGEAIATQTDTTPNALIRELKEDESTTRAALAKDAAKQYGFFAGQKAAIANFSTATQANFVVVEEPTSPKSPNIAGMFQSAAPTPPKEEKPARSIFDPRSWIGY